MGKKKQNERPQLPHAMTPPRVTASADNEEGTSDTVSGDSGDDAAPTKALRDKTRGNIDGPPRATARGGATRACPRDQKRGVADFKRTQETITISPASAILSTATLESTAGLRGCVGCVGGWGAWALGMMRLSSSE